MFEKKFEIDYQGLKWDYTVPLSKMLIYLQEASILHSESTGLTMDWFLEQKTGWVICNWDIEVIKPLKWSQKFTVRTYPCLFKGIMAHRGFEVMLNNEVILKASSKWVYTNRIKRRPVKVEPEMSAKYGELGVLPIATDFSMSRIENADTVIEKRVVVTRRDTDTNRHTNNVSYIEWVTDMLSDEQYNIAFIKKMKIAYHKECVMGDSLDIKLYNTENKFYSTIYKEDVLLTEIYFEM